MSSTTTALVASALVVIGLFALLRSWRRPRPTLRAVRARLDPARARVGDDGRSRPLGRLRDAIAESLAATGLGRRLLDEIAVPLRITGTTLPEVLGQIVTFAAVGFVTTSLGVAALIAMSIFGPTVLWIPLILLVTVLFAVQPVSVLRGSAERRRRELQRVTNDFVQMVAVALTTNRSIEEAVAYAADIGDSDGFRLLRRTIDSAQPMGVPVWEALGSMANTYELDELAGLANSMGRQAGVGVNIAATIRAEARSLRAKQLAALTDAADKANANLSLPTMGMVVGVIAFIGYPIVTQVLTAFSS